MKKIGMIVCLLGITLFFNGCSKNEPISQSENGAKKTGELMAFSTQESELSANPSFFGMIESEPLTYENNVMLAFESVTSISDPENIHDLIDSNGVLINIPLEDFESAGGFEMIKKGTLIEFTLVQTPVLNFSIPPQIPFESIQSIKILDEEC